MAIQPDLEAQKDLCRAFFAGLQDGDVDAAFAHCSDGDGCGWMDLRSVDGGLVSTFPERREALRWFLSQMEDGIRFEFDRITAEDDRVALQMRGRATLVSGTEYDQIYHMLMEVGGGSILRIWEYADALMTKQALEGLDGPPVPA